MQKTTFEITKMDYPSEEAIIRMRLDEISAIANLDFDIPKRRLTVFHKGGAEFIEKAILDLNLGGRKLSTTATQQSEFEENKQQKSLLWAVLLINFSFFIIEIITGLLSKSMGLVADSLDMLADSFVYGISMLAVGKGLIRKQRTAKMAGYFQIALALIGFMEIVRRAFADEQLPDFLTMIVISIFALIANGVCLYILQRAKSKDEVHIKASMIFTSNDVIINLGVITAGVLVLWLKSGLPDLVIGSIVFVLVMHGALRILKLSKSNS